MGTYKSICSWILKGVRSTNGCIATFWGVNFNMPTPDLWAGASWSWSGGAMSNRYCSLGGGTTSLSSLCPGYEVAAADALYRYCVTNGSCLNGIARTWMRWMRAGYCFVNSYQYICIDIQAPSSGWSWQMWENMYMTGIDSDEVCTTAMYGTDVSVDAYSGDNLSIGGISTGVCFTNVPSTARCGYDPRGNIWVEGNNLRFINANRWEHSMTGDCQGNVGAGNAGSIWIDNSHYLHWIGCTGNSYRAKWRICQFCSSWSNSSGPNPSPGASYKGALWADTEYGWTHLAYIGCDGNKYVVGSGAYPFTVP